MNEVSQNIISFAEFELDAARRIVRRNGETLPLNQKTFDLLVFLLKNNGRTLTKEEILEAVWSGQFVEEANLSVQISVLRKALGENKDAPRFLVTIPGKGYQFTADVREEADEIVVERHKIERLVIDEEIEDAGENETKRLPAASVRKKPFLFVSAVAALLLLIIAGVAAYKYFGNSPPRNIKSIAVLPFKPLVAENRNESLEMGMADTLIAKLGNLNEISVRPISAVRRYASIEQDALAAGREQQVDAVLDGQIQKSGDKIRVTVRLVRVADGRLIWTNQFDEPAADIFRLQDSISARVADSLALKLSGNEKNRLTKRETQNPDAYQLYLLGRFHLAKRSRDSIAKAIEYFTQAIEKDRQYAAAYAGLAAAYNVAGWSDYLLPHEAYRKAQQAVDKALQLDETNAEAHAVSGSIKRSFDWDLKGAEIAYRRALELDPNNPTVYQWYALTLAFAERYDESIALYRRALELDPLSPIINKSYGDVLSFARHFDEAIGQYQRVIELDPSFPYAHRELGTCYYFKNKKDEAIEEWLKSAVLSGAGAEDINALKMAYQRSGIKGFWLEMAVLTENSKHGFVSSYDVATYYAAAENKRKALDWLEKAYREHSSGMIAIKSELWFDCLRAEPRFIELTRRAGLSQ